VFGLVAGVRGLAFRDAVMATAELVGVAIDDDADDGGQRRPPTTTPAELLRREPPPPSYPPAAEVIALWDACVGVLRDDVATWLRSRSLDPVRLHGLGLVRSLPDGVALPSWASSWRRGGYLALVPTWDACGVMRSLRARRIGDAVWPNAPKEMAPKGFNVGELVMANGPALELLRGAASGVDLVVAEGATDFMAAAQQWPTYAVMGIYAGSWCDAIAERIPSTVRVIIATDDDEQGDKYAAAITTTIGSRCRLMRL
jgi:hypothetical protein